MAVKIRLKRRGRKKLALYDIVVADARAPRDGRFIEKLGNYNPHTHPATIVLAEDSALRWLLNGAQPTHTVRNLLSRQGMLLRKHLQVGVHKGAITQEDADKKWEAWKQDQESGAPKTTKTVAPADKKKSEQPKTSPTESASEQVQEAKGSPVTESPKEVPAAAPEQPQEVKAS